MHDIPMNESMLEHEFSSFMQRGRLDFKTSMTEKKMAPAIIDKPYYKRA